MNKITFSQNWQPFNVKDKYNYILEEEDAIFKTMWVDSFQVNNNDTLFYFNNLFIRCIPCDTNSYDENYLLKPNVLQKRGTKIPGGIYYFSDTLNFVLFTLANVNESWLYDTLDNITAKVTIKSEEAIFGNVDSVKTILLSNGDSIRLSKNYGVLQFPFGKGQDKYYKLVGIEGRNLGRLMPKMRDFYDFNVGDIFQYKIEGHGGSTVGYEKYYINDSNISGDTLIFKVEGIGKSKYYYGDTSFYKINTYWKFIDSINHPLNHYIYNVNKEVSVTAGNIICINTYHIGLDGRIEIELASEIYVGKQYYYWNGKDTLVYTDLFGPPPYQLEEYKTGLGKVFDYILNGQYSSSTSLIGYKKGIDTVGVLLEDCELMKCVDSSSLSQPSNQEEVIIYPNPSKGTFKIKGISTGAEVFIYNCKGKKVYYESENDKIFDISSFSPGLYLIIVNDSLNNIHLKKTIIKSD